MSQQNSADPEKQQQQQSLTFHFSHMYTLKLIFCVKHQRPNQQHGTYIKYSLSTSHSIFIWTCLNIIVFGLQYSQVSIFLYIPVIPLCGFLQLSFCLSDKKSTFSPI